MKRFVALATVAVFALASTLTATAAPEDNNNPKSTPHRAPASGCTIDGFRAFSSKVWDPTHWRRGAASDTTIRAQRRRIACAPPGHRVAMKRTWHRDQAAFFDHRADKLDDLRYAEAIDPPGAEVLAAIRVCESGGDYSINTGNGFFGAYQFTLSTWQSVGGSGYPHEASPREQDERAARLYREAGPSPWPTCGV